MKGLGSLLASNTARHTHTRTHTVLAVKYVLYLTFTHMCATLAGSHIRTHRNTHCFEGVHTPRTYMHTNISPLFSTLFPYISVNRSIHLVILISHPLLKSVQHLSHIPDSFLLPSSFTTFLFTILLFILFLPYRDRQGFGSARHFTSRRNSFDEQRYVRS